MCANQWSRAELDQYCTLVCQCLKPYDHGFYFMGNKNQHTRVTGDTEQKPVYIQGHCTYSSRMLITYEISLQKNIYNISELFLNWKLTQYIISIDLLIRNQKSHSHTKLMYNIVHDVTSSDDVCDCVTGLLSEDSCPWGSSSLDSDTLRILHSLLLHVSDAGQTPDNNTSCEWWNIIIYLIAISLCSCFSAVNYKYWAVLEIKMTVCLSVFFQRWVIWAVCH